MIKEKVYEILDIQEEINQHQKNLKLLLNEIQKERVKGIELAFKCSQLKQSLGKIIAPITRERKNILVEKDEKYYSVFYDRKLDIAHINECLTSQEADIKFALNKLTQGVNNEK